MPPSSPTPARLVRRYVRQALDSLPARYADAIENVEFVVARAPSPRERRRSGLRGTLYGLYEGIPLTHRTSGYDRAVPDRISIYWGPLLRDFPAEADLAREVHSTVLHEIGHYFGLDEDDLHHTRVE
jgi:predicted Zn-dependent protease with MMP-like domain